MLCRWPVGFGRQEPDEDEHQAELEDVPEDLEPRRPADGSTGPAAEIVAGLEPLVSRQFDTSLCPSADAHVSPGRDGLDRRYGVRTYACV